MWRGRVREQIVLRMASAVTAASAPVVAALAATRCECKRVALGVDLNVWPPRDRCRATSASVPD